MSAELLARAARVLREHAEAATPGPWQHVDFADPSGQPLTSDGQRSTFMGCGSVITVYGGDIAAPSGDLYPRGGYSPSDDMALIALLGPPVALALAAVLDATAEAFDAVPSHDLAATMFKPDLALARAILREPDPSSAAHPTPRARAADGPVPAGPAPAPESPAGAGVDTEAGTS